MATDSLRHFIRVYDGDLEPSLCQRLCSSFDSLERFQQTNGRARDASLGLSAWVEMNVTQASDAGFLAFFRGKMDAALSRYNRDVGLTIPVPNSSKSSDLILKRYRKGSDEQFQLHFDSIYSVSNRFLVFLWYLNDVGSGGETVFPDAGTSVAPRRGRLVIFPPYWMYQHVGQPAISDDKYILSAYLLF